MSINQSNMIFTIFRKTKLSRMRFVVNEHNQFANEGREKVHSASEVIIYPFYNELTVENDICLIYTDDRIEYGYGAEPICLPDDYYEIIDGEECYTAGWGKSSYNGAVNLGKVFR